MTGTDKIIAHIEADAKAQADTVLAEASKRCAEVKARYDAEASELYQEKIRTGVKACEDAEESALRICRMEARKSTLAVKQEMVARAFADAQKAITGLPAEQYTAFLAKLVREAGPAGDEELILSAKDRASVGEALVKTLNDAPGMTLRLSDETREMAGGLILRRGNVETNCSVELLVDLVRTELSSRVADLLFA